MRLLSHLTLAAAYTHFQCSISSVVLCLTPVCLRTDPPTRLLSAKRFGAALINPLLPDHIVEARREMDPESIPKAVEKKKKKRRRGTANPTELPDVEVSPCIDVDNCSPSLGRRACPLLERINA